ncbi:prepilin peptidase [Roseobacter sp. A03A-229]
MQLVPESFEPWATIWLATVLLWISLWDLKHLRIPNLANAALAVSGVSVAALTASGWPIASLTGALVGYSLFAAIGAAYFHRTGEDGLGLGDAKLLGGAGAWLGLNALPSLIAVAAVSALVYALVMKCRRLAFGPWLSASLLLHWLFVV